MRIFAGVRWRGWSLKIAIFTYFVLSSEHFTYISTRQLSRDATVDDLGDNIFQGMLLNRVPVNWSQSTRHHELTVTITTTIQLQP